MEAPARPGAPLRIDRRLRAMVEAAPRGEVLRVERTGGRQFIGAAELARLHLALQSYDGPTSRFVAVAPRLIGWADIAYEVVARVGAGSVEIIDEAVPSPVFDVSATERELGSIPGAWPALQRAIAARGPRDHANGCSATVGQEHRRSDDSREPRSARRFSTAFFDSS